MGKDCRLIGSPDWGSEPYLIKIGNHTEISCDVSFITHDGTTWVFRNQDRYKDIVRFGKIEIGVNCFIGARSTILPGVCIGDNSIIAAGALVNKSVPSGEIWGGVPAKFISKTEVYAEKFLRETPDYDKHNLSNNRKEEIIK